MKYLRPITVILSIVLASLTVSPASIAQTPPPPCVPDCFASPFGPTQVVVLTLPSGCIVRVWYSTRKACGIYDDLAIQKIENLTQNCAQGLSGFLDDVTAELFKRNPMGFPMPSLDSCVESYRVTKATCWRSDTVDCDGDTIAVPCDTVSPCCIASYQICADSVGEISITKQWTDSPNDSCPPSAAYCVFVCDAPPSGLTSGVEEDVNAADPGLSVSPNPASTSMIVRADDIQPGSCRVRLFSIDGVEMHAEEVLVSPGGNLELNVDLKSIPSGAYVLVVSTASTSRSARFAIHR